MSKQFIPGQEEDGSAQPGLSRRHLLTSATALAVAGYLARPRPAQAKDYKFAVALGWTTYESGRHLQHGYTDAIAKLGGTATVTDAGFDPKKQSDQIDSMISGKPDALFVSPADDAAIAPAIRRALTAGIPVFVSDSLVPGTLVTNSVLSDNFGMGYYTADWMAKKLGGKGNVATVSLPQNESWDERTLGMQLAFSRYPDIKVLSNWAYAMAGSVTPRQAVDNVLTEHADLNAIWCAWDGAGVEGALAVKAAHRDNVFLTSIDGGKQTFEYLKSNTPLKLSLAQSFYEMCFLNVFYAHELLAGRKLPRMLISPVYAVTAEMLANGNLAHYDTYDQPGSAGTLGWTRVL
jgi:ribose transport system substrate-binding protein